MHLIKPSKQQLEILKLNKFNKRSIHFTLDDEIEDFMYHWPEFIEVDNLKEISLTEFVK